MEREQEKSEQILKQIKNYDVEAQKQASEKQQQELLYQQKLVCFLLSDNILKSYI